MTHIERFRIVICSVDDDGCVNGIQRVVATARGMEEAQRARADYEASHPETAATKAIEIVSVENGRLMSWVQS